MRKTSGWVLAALLLVALFLVASAGGCSLGRRAARVPLPGPIYIHMVDASTGWVVAGGLGSGTGTAIVARTTDGGATWADVGPKGLSDREVALQAYTSKDAQTTWLATSRDGQPPDIWRTTDGGKTWRDTTTSIEHGLIKQLFFLTVFFGQKEGLLLVSSGSASRLYATGDRGATWALQGGLPALGTPVINAVDRDHVFLAYDRSILATSDGGRHWTTVYPGPGYGRISSLSFADPRNGWAVMADGPNDTPYLAQTADGGAHWQPVKAVELDR